MNTKNPTIFVLPGNTHNRGDRANILATTQVLRSEYPNSTIYLASFDAETEKDWYDVTVIQRHVLPRWNEWKLLKQSDVIVWGGGALLVEASGLITVVYWALLIRFVKLITRKPIIVWAQGYVLFSRTAKHLTKWVLGACDHIITRDMHSREILEELHINPEKITYSVDTALAIQPSSRNVGEHILRERGIDPSKKPIIAISPTFWHFYHTKNDWLPPYVSQLFGLHKKRSIDEEELYFQGMATIADALIERHNATVLLFAHYPSPIWSDSLYLEKVREFSKHKESIFVLNENLPTADDWARWHCFDLVLAHSLHNAIVSAATNTPCIHLSYEPKTKDFTEALGNTEWGFSWKDTFAETSRAKILKAANYLLLHPEEYKNTIAPHREKLIVQAKQNIDSIQCVLS